MIYLFWFYFVIISQLENPLIQSKTDSKWINLFDFQWRLETDGLSIGPFLLTGFRTTLVAWPITKNPRFLYFLMLAMYSGQIASYSSRDFFLFLIM
nr:NADH dehydrogenase subunit D [Phalaenopsis sp.]